MKKRALIQSIFIFHAIFFQSCNESGRKDPCSTKISQQKFEVMNDSVAYDYIKYSFDNNHEIDSALTNLFAIRSIGRDDKYFFLAHRNCCEQSDTKNELGYCNGYLAEHYFTTNRYELAAKTYGDVLSLLLTNSDSLDSLSLIVTFRKMAVEDQNLYLTSLFSRANSYFRMQEYELSKRDLDMGLQLSRKVNPIFIKSFEQGFK